MMHFDGIKMIGLNKIVKANAEQLSDDAYMFAENDKIFNPDNIFLVVNILFFRSHQDIYLV